MKEIKIEVPEGYEIDRENSTFETIKFKEKKGLPMSWDELGDLNGYVYDINGQIHNINCLPYITIPYAWPTKELAEAALALSQILQLRDRWNGDWKPNWEDGEYKYCIYIYENKIKSDTFTSVNMALAFKTPELRDKFLETFRDLIETAKPLL